MTRCVKIADKIIGDGHPCFVIAEIGINHNGSLETAKKLIAEDRVNFICKADYQEDKDIYKVVKRILQKIKADYDFNRLLEFHKNKALCNVKTSR